MRLKFQKGKQREFIQKVLERIRSPSLRELINRGISVDYSSLKNYYSERRILPENLFELFCEISKLDGKDFRFTKLDENWGQVKGGKKSKRKSFYKKV